MSTPKVTYNEFIERIREVSNTAFNSMEKDHIFSGLSDDPSLFLEEVKSRMSVCTDCVLAETRNKVVLADGTHNAKIMILSEGPGAMEDATGIPFTGPLELKSSSCGKCLNSPKCFNNKLLKSPTDFGRKGQIIKCNPDLLSKSTVPNQFYMRTAGSILDGVLSKTFGNAFPRQNWISYFNTRNPETPIEFDSIWYITNVVGCRSFNLITNQDTPPENVARNICKKWFLLQWTVVNPQIIISLGRKSLELLVGGADKASQVVFGEVFDTRYGKVIAQPHPAFLMREKQAESKALGYARLSDTLKKAIEFVN